jgi:hypothetical protein
MRYCINEHQHKAKAYIDVLRLAGYRPHKRMERAEFLLIDHEWNGLFSGLPWKWRWQIEQAEQMDVPIFLYPHSVRPNIPFDLTDQWYPKTTALYTIARGHKEVLRRIGYPHPIAVMGWAYTEIHPFRQKEPQDKISVLFAPIHPVGNGYLPDEERELNTKTYELLLGLMDDISLTVRHIGPLEKNGLWPDERVHIKRGCFDGSTSDMERADVVIGAFTYAYMAAALGHPLIMIGEGIRPHNSPRRDGKLIYARNWEKYRDYMRYPQNIEDCEKPADLRRLLHKAIGGGQAVEDWKQRFIGGPFDGRAFVKSIKGYL